MVCRVLLNRACVQRVPSFKCKHRLVFSAVILVHTSNILQQRRSPDKQQKQQNPNGAVDQVEDDPLTKYGIDPLQFRRCQQRQELVHVRERKDAGDVRGVVEVD